MLLEFSIGAKIPTIASIFITLCGHHSVEAPFSAIVGYVIVYNASFFLQFGLTETRLHLVSLGQFSLPVKVDIFFERSEILETIPEIVQSCGIVLQHADHLRYFVIKKRYMDNSML